MSIPRPGATMPANQRGGDALFNAGTVVALTLPTASPSTWPVDTGS
jgi:hypothetical protein